MSKESFRDWKPAPKSLEMVQTINSIIKGYQAKGYKLTLRQLYYQLVSRDIIPNQQKEYAKLSALLTNARMSGRVDWNAIEDRIRVPYLPYWAHSPADAISDIIRSYRRDRQSGQEVYIELWVEKDALSGVLKRITSKYHVNLMVNRGYSSASAMYDSANRLKQAMERGQACYIFYLGDHDPSGLDMDRDIRTRLSEFGVDVEVKRIALTGAQIKRYNPPPNPTKLSDSRAQGYIAEYGRTCWEVDALNPEVLNELVTREIEEVIDVDKYARILEKERKDKDKLKQYSEQREDDEEEDDDETGPIEMNSQAGKALLFREMSEYEYEDKESAEHAGWDVGSIDISCPICGAVHENTGLHDGDRFATKKILYEEHILEEHTQEEFEEWKRREVDMIEDTEDDDDE